MPEYVYDGSLEGLFAILDRVCRAEDRAAALPGPVRGPVRRGWETQASGEAQPDLFGESPSGGPKPGPPSPDLAAFLAASSAAIVAETVLDVSPARRLHGLSANAYDCFVRGWMSELPIEAELVCFALKVLDAGLRAPGGFLSPEARRAAETAAADRGDPDVERVLGAAYKVWKELDRLRGLLRFSPGPEGIHLARCAPDHFVLPGLAGHFRIRFGESAWAIIDERRGLALVRSPAADARILPLAETDRGIAGQGRNEDPWEALWRSYHRVINNETRSNQKLQKQFMPRRYWKYLPEAEE
ncbi:MAG: TIGR03915 family putative DNA repair protein [Treponema sp.]|nr:TIGR03915 family putative DNA repair protein [Treponema sp.]